MCELEQQAWQKLLQQKIRALQRELKLLRANTKSLAHMNTEDRKRDRKTPRVAALRRENRRLQAENNRLKRPRSILKLGSKRVRFQEGDIATEVEGASSDEDEPAPQRARLALPLGQTLGD